MMVLLRMPKEEGSHEDTGNEVAKGDEDGILCSRDFQREWVSEQETKNVGKTYHKEACKIRPVSIQGKGRLLSKRQWLNSISLTAV
uniref:Uncharacterized protein n=1 Tax=Anguilla anguilla TaxID=7936 RepID=A0A0E9REF7_ANGAN